MPGIKAVNSRNLSVINCKFSGFDTDIELNNVDGFVSDNNQFSKKDNNPEYLIEQLANTIEHSGLDGSSKERLFRDVIQYLSKKINFSVEKEKKVKDRLSVVGKNAIDFFIQLSAAVAAGLIMNIK